MCNWNAELPVDNICRCRKTRAPVPVATDRNGADLIGITCQKIQGGHRHLTSSCCIGNQVTRPYITSSYRQEFPFRPLFLYFLDKTLHVARFGIVINNHIAVMYRLRISQATNPPTVQHSSYKRKQLYHCTFLKLKVQ